MNPNSNRNRPYTGTAGQEARAASLAALGISPREERRYSITRALAGLASAQGLRGYEREVSEQLRLTTHREARSHNSALIPSGLLMRDLTAGTASAGGYLVSTVNQGATFIDLLRARLVCVRLGATVLSGLRDNVTIPKQTAGATAQWLANEGTAITESQQTLGQVSLTPKNVGAYTEISRQLLLQSNPAADALVMSDLARTVATAVDAAAINGSGASGQPTGILNTAGIGSVSGTSLGYSGVMSMVSTLANANAVGDMGALGFATTPAVAALLMQRQQFSGTDSPAWQGNVLEGTVAGCKAMASNGMPTATMIAGNWGDLLIGEWGILEVMINPFAGFSSGIVGVRAIQTVDVGVRHAESFVKATTIT